MNIYAPAACDCARPEFRTLAHYSKKLLKYFVKKITFENPKKTVDFSLNLWYHIITGKR